MVRRRSPPLAATRTTAAATAVATAATTAAMTVATPAATTAVTTKVAGPVIGAAHRAAAAAAAAAIDWLALDRQLCFALYAASLAMTKAYKPLLAPLGLTYPQYLVMLVIWEAESAAAAADGRSNDRNADRTTSTTGTTGTTSLTVSQLGDRLTLDSGTLTPLLKRLEAQGQLRRQRDAVDERRVRLCLTPAGRALRAQALLIPPAIACSTACDLQQIGHLAAQLTTLRQQLQSLSSGAAATA